MDIRVEVPTEVQYGATLVPVSLRPRQKRAISRRHAVYLLAVSIPSYREGIDVKRRYTCGVFGARAIVIIAWSNPVPACGGWSASCLNPQLSMRGRELIHTTLCGDDLGVARHCNTDCLRVWSVRLYS